MHLISHYIGAVVFATLLINVSFCKSTIRAKDMDVVFSIQKYFHSGCVTIVYSSEEIEKDLLAFKFLHIFQRYLMKKIIMTALLDIVTLNTTMEGFQCRRNRPLFIITTSREIIRLSIEQVVWGHRQFEPRWLMFLDDSTSPEEFFGDVNIPFDCEFLVAEWSSGDTVVLTEVYRVHGTHPLQTARWGGWSPQEELSGPSSSLYERRIDLQGLVFKAATIHNPPYELVTGTKDGELNADGAFSQLWLEVGRNLNLTTRVYHAAGNTWGAMLDGGAWSGAMGMVIHGEMDVAVSPFYMTSARQTVIDTTVPILISKACVYIRTPDGSSTKWAAFVSPFSRDVWLTVVAFILLFAVSLTLLHAAVRRHGVIPKTSKDDYSLLNSLQCVVGGFCSQGRATTPGPLSCRLVYWMSFITATILMSVYSANFVADLTVNVVGLPFTDLQGILDDDSYGFAVPLNSGIYTNFNNTTNAVMRKLFLKKILPVNHKLPRTSMEGLETVCSQRLAFMTTYDFYFHFGDKVPCHLSILPYASFPLYFTFILKKHSPYRRVLNYNLQKMYRSGVTRRLYNSKWYRKHPAWDPPPTSVDLYGVTPVLSMCAAGILFGAVLILLEKVASFLKKGQDL